MNFLEAWDLGISYAMELLQRDWLTPPMRFLTSLGELAVLGIVMLLAFLFFCFIGRWRTGVCLLLAGLLGFTIDFTVKPWVNRPRPELKWVASQDRKKSPSFPSGAALLSMAVYGYIALSLAAQFRGRLAALYVLVGGFSLAVLIGFSRMYLGVHYLSDVVAGFCAGLACALLMRWLDGKWTTLEPDGQSR